MQDLSFFVMHWLGCRFLSVPNRAVRQVQYAMVSVCSATLIKRTEVPSQKELRMHHLQEQGCGVGVLQQSNESDCQLLASLSFLDDRKPG